MADFSSAVTNTIANEGGARYTEIPGDAGGATKFGISKRAYPQLDIRMLSEDQAREIYRRDYWNAVKGDDIVSQAVAENLFDSAVNLGVGRAVRLAQLTVGVAQDGVPGTDTITAINQAPPDRFVADFTLAKIARYVGICNKDRSQSKFLLGWLNRAMGTQA
ncbi:glycosyl hydrolase 108 family protein [Paucibacter sp. R3-3]|uniref:Glycosyl hydrolase 108 family protein n=1 Tax=Roseateles agri TaxID=3098619 RepID=A0ABU5DML2_9BURK|nr:glycosyl hydrolase 108 family protein [Paucibacter sp. R3-3]MDY0747384.1 glycosyl hydrolase 108 family protein [Paucibacter sp. R3-3]